MRPIAGLLIAAAPILLRAPAPAPVKNRPLLQIKHEIISFGWTQNRVLLITQSGRISLSVQLTAFLSSERSKRQQPDGMLNPAELEALRNLLASTPVQNLHDSYSPFSSPTITSDLSESMTIEVNIFEKQKRILLPGLESVGAHNSTVYPPPFMIWFAGFTDSSSALASLMERPLWSTRMGAKPTIRCANPNPWN